MDQLHGRGRGRLEGGMVWRGREAEGRVRTWKGRWKDDDYQPTNLPTKSSVHIQVEGLSRSIPR
jgi:hypothetical protein